MEFRKKKALKNTVLKKTTGKKWTDENGLWEKKYDRQVKAAKKMPPIDRSKVKSEPGT